MLIVLQIVSIATVFALTLLFFVAIGKRTPGLLYTRKTAEQWRGVLKDSFGTVLTVTNIFGTLTSLATVYLFFIGSSKLFGWVTFTCCITIVIGAFVSNYLSRRISERPRPKHILASDTQSGAVIASLFWADDASSKGVSKLVRFLSLLSMAGIIWLEFALFGDISGKLLGLTLSGKALTVAVIAFVVFWFTFEYGLRGFVFADILHSGLIVTAVLLILIGTMWTLQAPATPALDVQQLLSPLLDWKSCALFAAHVLVLNSFLVVVSESHWMRMWLLTDNKQGNKEITKQLLAQLGTATVWLVLIIIGLLTWWVTRQIDTDAISTLLMGLSERSTIFLAAFWVGAMAALFSTADAQIYCFRLVQCFDVRLGRIPDESKTISRPRLTAILWALGISGAYWFVRYLGISFEKLIFTIIPSNLVLLPALLELALGRSVRRAWIILAFVLYWTFAVTGFFQPELSLAATLAAALSAFAVAIFAFVARSAGRNK